MKTAKGNIKKRLMIHPAINKFANRSLNFVFSVIVEKKWRIFRKKRDE